MRREWNSSLLEWGVGLTANHGLRRDNKPFLKPQVNASPDRRMGDAATILARATRDVGSTTEAMVAMKAMTVVDLIVVMAATATKETIEPSKAMKVMTANAEMTIDMHAPSTNAIPSSTDSLNGSAVRTLGGTAFTGSSRPLSGQGRSLLTTYREHIYRRHKLPPYHCRRCFDDLETHSALNLHYARPVACEAPATAPDGINDTQLSLLLSRKEIRNKTEEEKWAYMYQIVFPEDGVTPNPCELHFSSPAVCH